MRIRHFTSASLFVFLFAAATLPAAAQVVIATVPVGNHPDSEAVNPATNKTYVANNCGNDPNCQSGSGTVSVIDGNTFATQTVTVGDWPYSVAVNSLTNKTYVATCGSDSSCQSPGTVTVIDGATLTTHNVTVGIGPLWVAVDSATNKIYVVNPNCTTLGQCPQGTVTVIDGATLATQTVNVGFSPYSLDINTVTNKIYVANLCVGRFDCSHGTVTVIDGATLSTQSVTTQVSPFRLAVNAATNKIYVVNNCGTDTTCESAGSVTVIDGATLGTQNIPVGYYPLPLAVNPVTNKIYVGNQCSAPLPGCYTTVPSVSIIDGSTLATNTLSICAAATFPGDVQVNSVTNEIYLPCHGRPNEGTTGRSVDILNGATDAMISVAVGDYPSASALDAATNRVYVPNLTDATVSIIGGVPPNALQFVPVTPCRVVDTRNPNGPFGGPPIAGGTFRSFPLPQGSCNIPATAAAYSLNVTAVPARQLGYLSIWPTGEGQPLVSTLNSPDGRIKADAAIVPAGYQGAVSVYVTDTSQLILDIDGYFAPASGSTLAFYPLTPCRVADTRSSTFPPGLGQPFLPGGQERDFPILNATSCNIPSSAAAYSLNLSVVPHGSLFYLTVWPTGGSRPTVSTLNDIGGQIIANAAIVPAGTAGEVAVYPSNDTDLIIDINGYFGPPGTGGLSLYPAAPCRVIDTRHMGSGQPFSGTLSPPVDVVDSPCGPPATGQAYVFNATVVPTGPLGYLTLWPDGEPKPLVSTLNALDGSISNNMAIVPSTNGKVDAYASGLTQLILDISSYFAP